LNEILTCDLVKLIDFVTGNSEVRQSND
jgi:hypothetical protein